MKKSLFALIFMAVSSLFLSATLGQESEMFQEPRSDSSIDLWFDNPYAHSGHNDMQSLNLQNVLHSEGRTSSFDMRGSYQIGSDASPYKISISSEGSYSAASMAALSATNEVYLLTSKSIQLSINYNYELSGFQTSMRLEIEIYDHGRFSYPVQHVITTTGSGSYSVTLPGGMYNIKTNLYTAIEATTAGTHSASANVTYYAAVPLTVPEPSTYILVGLAIVAILFSSRRTA